MTELLFRPPALWVTLQGLLLLGLLLWHYAPRFGPLRPPPPPARRSKEEFLAAMAALLERKGDYADAWATARDDLLRELGAELGLPPGVPAEQVLHEAARRRPVHPDPVARRLQAGAPAGPAAFVQALHELETFREEFFHGRHHR